MICKITNHPKCRKKSCKNLLNFGTPNRFLKWVSIENIRFCSCFKIIPFYLTTDEEITCNEAIEADKEKVREEPYSLPSEFYWDVIDLDDQDALKELYELLSKNYVEDDDAMFRFDYPPEFLKW